MNSIVRCPSLSENRTRMFDSEIPAQRARTISPLPSSRTPPSSSSKLSSKLVVRLTIHGDKDRRLEVGPWSLDLVAYVVAVLPRRESGCRPLAGIDTQPRTLDVFVVDDPLALAGRDVVAARVVRNFDDLPEELVRLLLARARVLVAKVQLMDLFVVPTIGFDLLYGLVIVRLGRRDLVWINVTSHPTADWIARQITEAFPWDKAPRYLIRDRDQIYGAAATCRLRAMGIRDKPIAPGSPWQNAFAQRLIGSIRRECVDHIVVLGEKHLRAVLKSYARYYNETRTHRSLDKDAPISRPVQRAGSIISHALLGGLHHHYVRV